MKIGFTCSCFDLFHAGHVFMLKDAKTQCDYLIVGLQTDPTIDRPNKNKPIMSFEERKILVESCKYIDQIIEYTTENDLLNILTNNNIDIRILGSDYINKSFTGNQLNIPIYYHDRSILNLSTTSLRNKIYIAEKNLHH
jgi:glycerol-3-phosphate cytidylyltransferase|tara:strand:- start:133 stop:549 length:417 start_codon:yes stop_codon:yes gene_type:complete